MTGTIVNAAAVVAGGALGLCLRRGLPERVQDAAMQAGGLGVAMISLGGIFEQMLTAGPDGLLTSGGGMLLVLSLVLGGMAGEVMRIEDGWSDWVRRSNADWAGKALQRALSAHPCFSASGRWRFSARFRTASTDGRRPFHQGRSSMAFFR